MRIIFFIDSLGTGGAEKSMVELAKYLIKDHNVTFLCLDQREVSHEKEVLANHINIIYIKERRFLSKLKFLINFINDENPDIVHSVLVRSHILLRLSRIFINKPAYVQSLVNTPYSLERRKDSKLPWYKFILAKQLDVLTAKCFPSYYHSITRSVLEHYKPLYSIKNNYKIIYRGRNENKFLEGSNNTSTFNMINVGRQEFAKGQILILQALNYLESEFNIRNIYLIILGFKGKYSDNLQDYIESNNLEERVEIRGFVPDVEKQLVKANIFVFPSYYEGLGGSLIEAFAAKLPCVCSDIPVLREVVGNKDGALFSPPGDYMELAKNILKLYKDEDLRNKLSAHSYTRFQEAFKLETINQEMLAMYQELIVRNNKE